MFEWKVFKPKIDWKQRSYFVVKKLRYRKLTIKVREKWLQFQKWEIV